MPEPRKNALRAALKTGRVCLGSFQLLNDLASTEILLGAGFEFTLIDAEHRGFDPHRVETLIVAAHGVGPDKAAMVRIKEISRGSVQYALDSGADGVLVPLVNSRNEAERVVEFCRYPPLGTRGLNSAARAARWGQPDAAAYAAHQNENTVVFVQIETAQGLENVEAVAQTPGLDGLFVGPMDLSHGMGLTGQFGHPKVRAAIAHVFQTGLENGKFLGVLAPDREFGEWCVKHGARFVVCLSDARYLKAATEKAVEEFKHLEKSTGGRKKKGQSGY